MQLRSIFTARKLRSITLLLGILLPAAEANALPNVSIDLGVSNTSHGLIPVTVADGDTTPASIGGLDVRRNLNPGEDAYMYFAVDDALGYRGSKPYVWIYFHYFDAGTGSLRVQYDAITNPYKEAPIVTFTGTNTWKVYSAEVTDAFFGNRQNGGADFRIAASPDTTFYVDLAYVRVPAKRLPAVDITPTQFGNGDPANPGTWFSLCLNPTQWPTALKQTDGLGYASQHLYAPRASDADLQQCFANIRAMRRKFTPAVGAIKEDCLTGAECFNKHVHEWDRFVALGASLDMFHIDEPLTNVRIHNPHLGDNHAVNETVNFMRLVRQKYPHIQLVEIESYPAYINAAGLQWWIRALNAACAASSVQIIDFFQVDFDWQDHNLSKGTAADLLPVRAEARRNGILFGANYWAAKKGTPYALEQDWYLGLMEHGRMYAGVGLVPDLYSLNDWIYVPRQIIPDTAYPSFTNSVRDFVNSFVTRTVVQPDFVDVPIGHVFYDQIFTIGRNDIPGCAWDQYCPDQPTTRGAMARYLLKGKEGARYTPPKCVLPSKFDDVPCGTDEAIWVNEIAARSVTAGCDPNDPKRYCPTASVTREQMSIFLLRTLEGPTYSPPACTTPTFADVPCSSPFAKWIEELARRRITGGCGNGNFCPYASVSRGQMAVFVDTTFAMN